MQALAEELCGGSITPLLTHLVQNRKLSARERAALRDLIDRLDAASRKERTFLAMCLAEREHGREYLERLEEGHFSSDALRAVRDHVVAHFDDPLADLPEDPMLSALVTEVAMRGQEEQASPEALRLTFLELELQRLERELRHATRESNFERQRDLWPVREGVKAQINELMGQTQ